MGAKLKQWSIEARHSSLRLTCRFENSSAELRADLLPNFGGVEPARSPPPYHLTITSQPHCYRVKTSILPHNLTVTVLKPQYKIPNITTTKINTAILLWNLTATTSIYPPILKTMMHTEVFYVCYLRLSPPSSTTLPSSTIRTTHHLCYHHHFHVTFNISTYNSHRYPLNFL